MLILLIGLSEHWPLFNVFRYITFRTGGAIMTSLVFALAFGPAFISGLSRWQGQGQPIREDGPAGHLTKKQGTPTMGGILILAGITVSAILWADLSNVYVWMVIIIMLAFGLIGFADDRIKLMHRSHKGLTGKSRLLLEFILSGAIVMAVSVYGYGTLPPTLAFPFFKDVIVNLWIMFIPFAAFVITGSANAVNLTDGLDGLAIVPVMIAAAAFGLIAYLSGNIVFANYLQIQHVAGSGELAVLCGAIIGAGMGFLWFNAPPAAVFMGDTGSLGLGGALGAIAVAAKHEIILAIVGFLFVVEAASVMMQVASYKLTGRRIFKMAPIHHHFEQLGWPESQIVIRFWILAVVFALIGLSSLKLR